MTLSPRALAHLDGSAARRLMHEVEGLLRGIQADGRILPAEVDRLRRWREAVVEFSDVHPFLQICVRIDCALHDGVLDGEEVADLLFVTQKLTTVNPYFDAMRTGLQQLMGLLAGYVSDGHFNDRERQHLIEWADEWQHLKGLWPFDECESLAIAAADGTAAPEAIRALFDLAKQLPIAGDGPPMAPAIRRAVYAADPMVEFAGRQFVFTGEPISGQKADLEALARSRGGLVHSNVTLKCDYLVVCAGGSEHWAFSCYGRKIEQAIKMRQTGHRVVIVHERDFRDALN